MCLRIYLVLCTLFIAPLHPQQSTDKFPDSLLLKSYLELFNTLKAEKRPDQQQVYLAAYLTKARKEMNREKIVQGYKNYLHRADASLKLTYADSMIYAARKSGNSALIGSAYLTKGITYYGLKEVKDAMDQYIIAYDYIKDSNDEYQKHKVTYMIGHVKYYLGYYSDAVELFNQCLAYFKTKNHKAYLNTLHSLGLCHNQMGNYGLCSETNNLGLLEAQRFNDHRMDMYFNHSEGINDYKTEDYDLAINKLTKAIPKIMDQGDFANVSVGYFYLGRSYWALGKTEKALTYFKKVDEIFNQEEYIRPDLREGYELLIKYYESSENLKTQLYYIKQLRKVDDVLNKTYRYLSGQIYKEYDTRKLKQQEKKIENLTLQKQYSEMRWGILSGILLLIGIYVMYRYVRNKKKYKVLIEELQTGKIKKKKPRSNSRLAGIKPEVVKTIVKQLEKFEKEKGFLQQEITLVKLAAAFDANDRYLSKVIWHYKNKRFGEYINTMRIEYMLYLLKNEKIYRAYSVKALAKDAGFTTTQRFVNAFKHRTGVAPSYFIDDLSKKE
ncbi:AraC family transcriptional regulator [Sinomicrobium weinanense]|uniref:Helix-turn-helix domain-containing protein n=1 Tax=Sinomicrobium weinanense TaxID=2842200 RepID=A0A926Q219_9FLAO|nr:AraC family transcriptional regulator [Sinomicrobium weinanense]MBC9795369.1 helix-turn-helix domain-containing protein [Sinomicrobium weinanense]MBU3122916.1 helix-turn-helix domain-containing protein [Sinomicrobium weinanense]